MLVRSRARRQLAEARAQMAADLAASKQDNKWLTEEVARQKQALGATGALLDKADQKLRDAFQSLAAEALKDNRAAFLDLAKTSFAGFQQPIAETLAKVDLRLTRSGAGFGVSAFAQLAEQISALGSTTHALSRALRTPSVRGRWGEMQLRRVVELAGMLHRCDFEEQPGLWSDTGRLRPDMIVRLPLGKSIVVMAQPARGVPRRAGGERRRGPHRTGCWRTPAASANTWRRLGSKAYWEAIEGESPEMVVMFLPGETLFSAALEHDLSLIEYGLKQRVLLASPITLIALLTTVAHTWRQEVLAENYKEVARLGKEFYERLARFASISTTSAGNSRARCRPTTRRPGRSNRGCS